MGEVSLATNGVKAWRENELIVTTSLIIVMALKYSAVLFLSNIIGPAMAGLGW
jgi:hypothetical protein